MAEGLNEQTSGLLKPILKAKDATADMAANTAQTTKSIKELEANTAKTLQTDFAKNLDTLRNNISVIGKSFKKLKNIQPLTDKDGYDKTATSSGKINNGVKDLMKRAGTDIDTLQ
jgi:transcriptional regulator